MYLSPEIGELELSEVEKLTSEARSVIAGPNSVRREGEYFVAVEPNSFGLPSVDTCPGRTDYCEMDCYAIESEKRTATAIKLQRNLDVLESIDDQEAMTEKIRTLVGMYITRADKLGIDQSSRRFRIHWSGDFFSVTYAEAWATVIKENPDISFWTYTRSFQDDVNVVPALDNIQNLDFFLSVDQQNVDAAAEAISGTKTTRIAYLVDYEEDALELAIKLGRTDDFRLLACPENMRKKNGERKLPVISKQGGACARCTYCIGKNDKNWDVVFVKTGQKERLQGEFPIDVPVTLGKRSKTVNTLGSQATAYYTQEKHPSLF